VAIRAKEIKKGMVLQHGGDLCVVTSYEHITPGNWRAIHQVELRNLRTGSQVLLRLGSSDTVEVAYLEKRACEYLYREPTGPFVFMNTETYDQISLSSEVVGDAQRFLVENATVTVVFHETTPISIELPTSVTLRIVESEHAVKGDSVTNLQKLARLETGHEIRVPLHVQPGELVRVSTETGEFLSRAKE